jgi:hypothetical protein
MWFPETSIKAQTHCKSNNISNDGKTKLAINERGDLKNEPSKVKLLIISKERNFK